MDFSEIRDCSDHKNKGKYFIIFLLSFSNLHNKSVCFVFRIMLCSSLAHKWCGRKKECLKKKYCKNEFVSVKSCALPPQFWGRIRVNLSDRGCVFAYGLQVNIYMHTSVLTLGVFCACVGFHVLL